MNWGTKIILAFVAFAMFLGVLIYRAYQADMDLVAADYYKQELNFQEQIDKLENERALSQSVNIEHDKDLKKLLIRFPDSFKVESGELALYRPSDATMDLKVPLHLDQHNTQTFSTEHLATGLWQVKLEWQDMTRSYLKHQNLYLP